MSQDSIARVNVPHERLERNAGLLHLDPGFQDIAGNRLEQSQRTGSGRKLTENLAKTLGGTCGFTDAAFGLSDLSLESLERP